MTTFFKSDLHHFLLCLTWELLDKGFFFFFSGTLFYLFFSKVWNLSGFFVLFLIVWNWVRKCWEKTFSPMEHLAVVFFSLLRSKRVLQNKTQKKKKKIWLTKLLFTQFHTCKNICFFHRISYINVSIFFVSTDGKIKDLGEKIRRIVFKYMCETD